LCNIVDYVARQSVQSVFPDISSHNREEIYFVWSVWFIFTFLFCLTTAILSFSLSSFLSPSISSSLKNKHFYFLSFSSLFLLIQTLLFLAYFVYCISLLYISIYPISHLFVSFPPGTLSVLVCNYKEIVICIWI